MNFTYNNNTSVYTEELPNGVWLLRLGNPDESTVTLNESRLISFQHTLAKAKQSRIKGLIITGPRYDMFCAGADVKLINQVEDSQTGYRLARQGQKVFDDLASLPFPTIAAISGPCVGGGFELALACTYRVCSDDPSTLIGLPETRLGIIPGFGGTQRLPRLCGIRKSLDVILAGKTLRSAQAFKYSLVDFVVGKENLLDIAHSLIFEKKPTYKRKKLSLLEKFLTFTRVGRQFVIKSAERSVLHKTKGFYPAQPAALKAVDYGLRHGVREGLDFEAKELGHLIVTPECKALVNIFYLTESAKKIGKTAIEGIESYEAAIIGSGTMGAGIAGLMVEKGFRVALIDSNKEALKKGMDFVKNSVLSIKYLKQHEKDLILNRVTSSSNEPGNNVRFLIEAIIEDITVKKELFSKVATKVPNDAIIATNTSSLSVTEMSSVVPFPKRFIGLHFFNPVNKMPLVEIIRGKETSNEAVVIAAALASKLGKFPVVVDDVPGFLVNRILTPYLNTAINFLASGFSISEIDISATAFGLPMGPLRLLDEVGLDVASHVAKVMTAGYGERMSVPEYAAKLVASDRKGKKNKKGFYNYKGKEVTPAHEIYKLLGLSCSGEVNSANSLIAEALILSLINEAVLCLDEGVAGIPSQDAADQINLATVMGMGFPPFRGGVLYYANTLGAANILTRVQELKDKNYLKFPIADGIIRRSARNTKFC